MKDKKKLLIGTLCALIMIMTVGYAILAQQLKIRGTAAVESTWNVRITNIEEKEKSTGATTKSTSYDATTANFNVGFISPGDYAIYEIEVSNLGTLDALIKNVEVSGSNFDVIKYELIGINEDDYLLEHDSKLTFSIRVEYNRDTSSQPINLSSNIMITLNCVEAYGNEETTNNTKNRIVYTAYEIGDIVNFAGSEWYVIDSSSNEQDYVTVMKKNKLSSTELGEYEYIDTHICSSGDVNWGTRYNGVTCGTVGQVIPGTPRATMAYYWSDNCHNSGKYLTETYPSNNTTNCSGHNTYNESKVREFLEQTYLPTIDPNSNKLKSVSLNGTNYKVRLISLKELQDNFGYNSTAYCSGSCQINYRNTVPSWLYSGINYWAMSESGAWSVWYVGNGPLYESGIQGAYAVRPVINLLKSSVENQ